MSSEPETMTKPTPESEDSWETNALENLKLNPPEQAQPAGSPDLKAENSQKDTPGDELSFSAADASNKKGSKEKSSADPLANVDDAILQALADRERATVIKVEALVLDFIIKSDEEILEFPKTFTNYQRMLAHRVGQHYGLQTITVDSEAGSFATAKQTKSTKLVEPKLSELDVSTVAITASPLTDRTASSSFLSEAADSKDLAVKPKLLTRRPDGADGGTSTSTAPKTALSIQEREEDYQRARERILGSVEPKPVLEKGKGSTGSLGSAGRAGGGSDGGSHGGGRGRGGRRAMRRDRDREEQDPDYARDMSRMNHMPGYDPRMDGGMRPNQAVYPVTTYNNEFPSLGASSPHMHGPNGPAANMMGNGSAKDSYSPQGHHPYQQPWAAGQQGFVPPPPPPPPRPGPGGVIHARGPPSGPPSGGRGRGGNSPGHAGRSPPPPPARPAAQDMSGMGLEGAPSPQGHVGVHPGGLWTPQYPVNMMSVGPGHVPSMLPPGQYPQYMGMGLPPGAMPSSDYMSYGQGVMMGQDYMVGNGSGSPTSRGFGRPTPTLGVRGMPPPNNYPMYPMYSPGMSAMPAHLYDTGAGNPGSAERYNRAGMNSQPGHG